MDRMVVLRRPPAAFEQRCQQRSHSRVLGTTLLTKASGTYASISVGEQRQKGGIAVVVDSSSISRRVRIWVSRHTARKHNAHTHGSCTFSGLQAAILTGLLMLSSASAQYEVEDLGNFDLIIESTDYIGAIASVASYLDGPGRSGLEGVVDRLNAEINLDRPVEIVFATWSEIDDWSTASVADRREGAFFDRGGTEDIYISYEMLVRMLGLFDDDVDAWYPNVINIVLHEIGHALIEINDIDAPRGGDEAERAADELAFFVFSELYEAEAELELVAEQFWRAADNALDEENDHFPDQVRAQRYECWIDGRLRDGSSECELLYDELVDSWDERLAPSWKGQFGDYD
jgi:hypothetical protein